MAPTDRFVLGDGVTTDSTFEPYRRQPHDPVCRPLRVYTQDPGASRFDGAIAVVDVPWEPVGPGPTGRLFVVRDVNRPTGAVFEPVDLDSTSVVIASGLSPSTTNPGFAQQMTYAVAMATYERFHVALGRIPEFAPTVRTLRGGRLEIRPHFDHEDNAYYDPDDASLSFGYVTAPASAAGRTQKGAYVFTSLSHDVIAHEMTHALLDGMRPHLMRPSNPDVPAFHEGFADLIALLMRFRYKDVVRRGLEQSKDGGLDSRLLTEMAREWGRTDADGRSPLRMVTYHGGEPDAPIPATFLYDAKKECHDLGNVLVAAVFEGMSRVFDRRTRRIRKLAEHTSGARDHVLDLLCDAAADLAGQFLNIVIRAIDYCPPLDITFGEFLRAMVTADFMTVPADPHGYREAMVLAFRRYGIVVPHVPDLSEDALLWKGPEDDLGVVPGLEFSALRHRYEPGWFVDTAERTRRANALGAFVTSTGRHKYFGLVDPATRKDEAFEAPVVESVRTLRRLTPDDDLDFHVVAEVTQRVKRNRRWFYGGSTIVISEDGRVRYVIGKGVSNERRQEATDDFLDGAGRAFRGAFAGDKPVGTALMRAFHSGRRR